jgi:polyketide synthase 13
MTDSLASEEDLRHWMREKIASMLGVPADTIDPDGEFASHGLDSAAAVELLAELELRLDRELATTLIWDYPTIRALASELAKPSK